MDEILVKKVRGRLGARPAACQVRDHLPLGVVRSCWAAPLHTARLPDDHDADVVTMQSTLLPLHRCIRGKWGELAAVRQDGPASAERFVTISEELESVSTSAEAPEVMTRRGTMNSTSRMRTVR